MGKLSYTAKCRLSVTMAEVLKYCEPKCLRQDLSYYIKQELMQCAEGIINGDFGGAYIDCWRSVFYIGLEREGIVTLKPKFYEDFPYVKYR